MEDGVPEISAPVIDRFGGDELFHAAEEIGRRHNVARRNWRAHGNEIVLPVERWRERLHLRQRHLIVHVLGIAPQNDIHCGVGERSFYREH